MIVTRHSARVMNENLPCYAGQVWQHAWLWEWQGRAAALAFEGCLQESVLS